MDTNNQSDKQGQNLDRTIDERLIKEKKFSQGPLPEIKQSSIDAFNATYDGTSASLMKNDSLSSILPDGNEPIPLGSGVIDGLLGEGGMARVYRIWNSKLEMYRAVKILLPTERADLKDRFETEIKISAKLHHPNIVETYTVGEFNGLPYIEMELVDGVTLESLINQNGKIPIEVSASIAIQVARALCYAHSQEFLLYGKVYKGIIHRDLKPANIIISKSGIVKLMDFGIARPSEVSLHTISGNIVGTLPYLSPEQLDGEEVDQRSDIYSYGTIVYEALTGEKTFPQTTVTNLMRNKVTNNYRSFESLAVTVPNHFAKVVEKCLNQNKNDRFASAAEIENALVKFYDSVTHTPAEVVTKEYFDDPIAFVSKCNKKFRVPFSSETLIIAGVSAGGLVLLATIIFLLLTPPKNNNENSGQVVLPVKPDTAVAVQPPSQVIPDTVKRDTFENTVEQTPPVAKGSSFKNEDKLPGNVKNLKGRNQFDRYAEERNSLTAKKNTDSAKKNVQTVDDVSSDFEKKYGSSDWVAIGEAACKAGHYSDAIVALEKMPFNHAQKEKGAILLASAYLESGQIAKASSTAQSIRSEDALLYLITGRIAYANKNYSSAIEDLELALTRPSSIRTPMMIRGDALYYLALSNDSQYASYPTTENKQQALLAWNNLKRIYISQPDHPRFKLANQKLASF